MISTSLVPSLPRSSFFHSGGKKNAAKKLGWGRLGTRLDQHLGALVAVQTSLQQQSNFQVQCFPHSVLSLKPYRKRGFAMCVGVEGGGVKGGG